MTAVVTEWLPGFEQMPLGSAVDGEPYASNDPWKVELHTTEGDSAEGAFSAYRPYPPHILARYDGLRRVQHISLGRASYSNKGTMAERSHIIQVEIVGRAENAPYFWEEEIDWLGTDVLAPIFRAVGGFTLTAAPQAFHGAGEGIVLASPRSPIRFATITDLRNFSGVLGHQHMPAPDSHWDPGKMNIIRMLVACAWSLGQNPVPFNPPPVVGTAPLPTWYEKVLKFRKPLMRGFDVGRVQQQLISWGYGGGIDGQGRGVEVDGYYGNVTAWNVGWFQADKNLAIDQVVGPNTARQLGG